MVLKSLKPTMREKKRYLKVEGKDLKKNIERAILEFVGVLGLSKAGLKIIRATETSAVIAVNREAVDSVRASFAVFPEKIEVTRVTGSLGNLK